MREVLDEMYWKRAEMAVTLTRASHTGMDVPYYGKRANRADRGNNFRLRGYGFECVLHPCDGNHIYNYTI